MLHQVRMKAFVGIFGSLTLRLVEVMKQVKLIKRRDL